MLYRIVFFDPNNEVIYEVFLINQIMFNMFLNKGKRPTNDNVNDNYAFKL